MRQLTITCDDCGLSEGINRATAALHEHGMATAASLMLNLPATQHALELFASYPELEIGVHLNLTEGYALTQDATPNALVNSAGRFRPRYILIANAWRAQAKFLASVEAELTAQVEAILALGVRPGHLTTHLHFHSFSALREIVHRLARHYAIPWVRAGKVQKAVVPWNRWIQPSLNSAAADGVAVPDYAVAVNYFYWLRYNPQKLARRLKQLSGDIELIVHPGEAHDPTFPGGLRYPPRWRAGEVRYFQQLYALLQVAD